jgi:hypothetical protein
MGSNQPPPSIFIILRKYGIKLSLFLIIVGQDSSLCQRRITVNSNLCDDNSWFLNTGHELSDRNRLRDIVTTALVALVQRRHGIISMILPYRTIVTVVKIGMVCLFCYLLIYQVNLAPLQKSYIGGFR